MEAIFQQAGKNGDRFCLCFSYMPSDKVTVTCCMCLTGIANLPPNSMSRMQKRLLLHYVSFKTRRGERECSNVMVIFGNVETGVGGDVDVVRIRVKVWNVSFWPAGTSDGGLLESVAPPEHLFASRPFF